MFYTYAHRTFFFLHGIEDAASLENMYIPFLGGAVYLLERHGLC